MQLKGSKTEKNLLMAFAGESQARNRYTYFAGKAKKEGLEQIAEIFEQTAGQEQTHAKQLFKFLEGGEVEITAAFPAGVIGSTGENLIAAAEGEHHESSEMYPELAETAKQEGFSEIAALFRSLVVAETYHENRYRLLAKQLADNTVFARQEPVTWICRKCGYTANGKNAPKKCPLCNHPQGYFEILTTDF